MGSPVILICVQNPDFIDITATHLHQHFSQYGEIDKILIFERNKPVWKALAQFENVAQANKALAQQASNMNGLSILVYQSQKKILEFSARNQYSRYYKDQPQFISQSLILGAKNPIEQKQVQSQVLAPVKPTQKPDFSSLSTHFTHFNIHDPGPDSEYSDDEIDFNEKPSQGPIKELDKEDFLHQFEKVINKNIDCLKSFSDFQTTFNSQQLPQIQQTPPKEKVFQSEILEQKKLITRVIYVNWFDPKQTTMSMIYNIFSTFGNIVRMIYFRTKCNVLIEYTTEISVKFLLTNFNDSNSTLFGQKLKVYPSNYEQIFFRNCEPGQIPKNTEEEEYYVGDEKSYRYQNNNFKYLVPPSNQIMLTNLKKEFCEEGMIFQAFYKFGKIESIKLLCEEKNKNKCLLKYTEIESAMFALASMHNYTYNNRKIQIFFSKTKC